mgnify:FL=1
MDKIQHHAMLVKATVTKFTNSVKDSQLAEELAISKSANPSVITVTKRLFNAPVIKELSKAHGQLRNSILNPITLAWDDGERMIKVTLLNRFESEWETKCDKIEDLKRELRRAYPEILKRASNDLGLTFNINDFPDVETVIGKYSASYELKPLPDSDDIRVDLPADKLAKVKAAVEAKANARVEAAAQEIHERVVDTLQSFIDGLERHGTKPDGAVRASKFSNNTVDKIEALAQILPALNITGCPKLTLAGNALLSQLSGLDADHLRESDTDRKATAATAKSIVDNLTGLWD